VFSAWCRDENILLHHINNVVVDDFVEHLRMTHKPHKAGQTELSTYTLAGYVRVIKSFLSWCVLHDDYGKHVKATTVSRIKAPHIEETIIETFTVADIEALFDACHREESEHLQVRDTAILSLLVDSGIRASELCTLTIGNTHLDPKDPYIRIFGKGRKWGEVGLGEQSRLAVGRYLRKFREPTIEYEVELSHPNVLPQQFKKLVQEAMQTAYLFVNRYGEHLTRSGLYRMIDRLGDWAGIEGVRCSPHDFRHYYAKRFMQQGGNIYQLSKILRHSSIRVTEEYLKSLHQSEVRRGAPSILDGLRKER
jgi:integrase/recombinase XerD